VEAIWPNSSLDTRSEIDNQRVLPLRTFIKETLRRSRTSYSTLQAALYYLILIKPHVHGNIEQLEAMDNIQALQCGRRMFLAALILASKYLQDKNYSARTWSKACGLNTLEINQNNILFLKVIDWRLHIPDIIFQRWTAIVLNHGPNSPPSPSASPSSYMANVPVC
jgi:PHO85 cyclin-5